MLYEFMTARRDEILGRCLVDLRNKYPEYSDDELMAELPGFFDQFIAALRFDAVGDAAETPLSEPVAAQHAALRKEQGFDLARLVHDFGLICEKTTEVASLHEKTFTPREFQIFNRSLDEAMAKGIESFSEQADRERSIDISERRKQLAFLAHEIRNALGNAMAGFHVLRQGNVAVKGATADLVHRALSRIAALLPDILTDPHGAEMPVLRPGELQLREFLGQVAAESFPERGIRVELDVPADLSIEADPALLTSALGNLLQNAIKFTRDNESVILRAYRKDRNVSIEVEDRCGGLPETSVEDLFKPFVQKHSDRRGMGLGLAIARRAVEGHAGHITIRNLPGVGCIFEITLPLNTPSTLKAV
jgi:signal transduction histidine kinase